MNMTTKQWLSTVTAAASAGDEAEMTISTASADRDRDRVRPEGADTRAFMKNPVLLWAHDPSSLPIGSVTALDVRRDGLRARWRWLEGDAFADRVRNAWSQRVIGAASIGFLPRESRPNELGGQDYIAWELLEVSLCGVPSNPEATRTLKALGLLSPSPASVLDLDPGGEIDLPDYQSSRAGELDVTASEVRFMLRTELTHGLREIVERELRRHGANDTGVDEAMFKRVYVETVKDGVKQLVRDEINRRRGRLV